MRDQLHDRYHRVAIENANRLMEAHEGPYLICRVVDYTPMRRLHDDLVSDHEASGPTVYADRIEAEQHAEFYNSRLPEIYSESLSVTVLPLRVWYVLFDQMLDYDALEAA